jgi:uncharacterized protein DUF4136
LFAVKRGRIISILAAGTLLALGGCAMQAQSDHDARFLMASCHSYIFSDQQAGAMPTSAAFDNPLNAKRMRDAIASSLAAHHVPPAADATSADCLVSYSIGSRLAPDPFAPQYAWGFGAPAPLGWGRYAGAGAVWGAPYAYREGRVTVDLFDARSHQALWHAFVDTDVTELTGAEADSRIRAAVAAIFEKFPPLTAAAPDSPVNKS